jgi:hypothetical protein
MGDGGVERRSAPPLDCGSASGSEVSMWGGSIAAWRPSCGVAACRILSQF